MEIITNIKYMREILIEGRKSGKKIGLVPTMGFLHEGHLSLVKEALKENDTVVVSIFVNPTQFGPDEDYDQYPRDLKRDAAMVEELGVDYIFSPEVAEMYPKGYNTYVEVEGLTDHLCGRSRPEHFRGVTTVVSKLFNIVQPDRAYFGQKDFQQLVVIKQMVADLNLPIEIKGVPIVREEDGLALSSRNKYLSPKERKAALILYKALNKGKDLILKGEKDAHRAKNEIIKFIKQEPLARIDYVAAVHPDTLKDVDKIDKQVLLALAIFIGETRLIDNMLVERIDSNDANDVES